MTTRTFWRVQLVVWPLYGLVHYLATLPAITPDEHWHMAGIKAVRALSGLLVSSPLPLLYRPILAAHARPPAVVAVSCGVALALGNLWLALDRTLLAVVRSVTPLQVNWDRFPRGFDLDYAFVLLVWSGGYIAVWHWQEAARRREDALQQAMAARDAQLRSLTYQVSPHFLFNTLNSLRSAIAEDPLRAREMVTRLAAFLRYSLATQGETPVRDEVEMIRAYLAIEQARFERGVDAAIDVDPRSERFLVPSLVLQPLVENALKHGTPDATGARRVRVTTSIDGSRLRLEVANTGSLSRDGSYEAGIGIRNTRERLAHVYGERQRIHLSQDGGWVRAVIEIDEPGHGHPAGADR